MSFIIKQHTGLGDYIICNSIIRHFSSEIKVILPVPRNYLPSVSFMYRDNPNIECVQLEGFDFSKLPIKTIGFDWTHHPRQYPDENFEEMFFRHAEMPFKEKENFFIVRDSDREKKLFDTLNLIPDTYIVIHEYTHMNNGKINRTLLPSDKKIISLGVDVKSENIFDYGHIINCASEVHTIESSFLCMIDLWKDITNKNIFCHRYSKRGLINSWMLPKLCKNWTIYDT